MNAISNVFNAFSNLAARVNALGDIARLLVDGGNHGTGVRVESVQRVVIADGCNDATHKALEVDVSLRRDFARDHNQAGRGQSFGGDAAVWILFKAGVQYRIRNLVGNLIRMAFGH